MVGTEKLVSKFGISSIAPGIAAVVVGGEKMVNYENNPKKQDCRKPFIYF